MILTKLEKANYMKKDEKKNDHILLLASKERDIHNEDVWCLDSRANNHTYEHKHNFLELDEGER